MSVRERMMGYDSNNIFAKILRGEIPCDKVYEDEHVLAFNDIAPKAPVHVLVIPKGAYGSLDEMAADGKDAEIAALFRAIAAVARKTGVTESGYRVISNNGDDGGQEVPHLHFHVLGGRPIGPMVKRAD